MIDTALNVVTATLGMLFQSGLLGPAFIFACGFAVGCWFYRWMLKRNPAKLELWAAEAKALRILTEMKLKGKVDK